VRIQGKSLREIRPNDEPTTKDDRPRKEDGIFQSHCGEESSTFFRNE
ncbi:hypothetical protein CANINC_001697, partial [Pichia inconspicua]